MHKTSSLLAATTLLIAASHLAAQTTGSSNPAALNDDMSLTAPAPAKPSPAVAFEPTLHQHEAATTPTTIIVKQAPAPVQTAEVKRPNDAFTVTDDINSGIVTEVPAAANELPEGTLLKVRLQNELTSGLTPVGEPFTATLTGDVERHGKVIFPEGAVINGRVSQSSTGHHGGHAASLHLEPETLTLPDGTSYKLAAQVIDLGPASHAHISSEGTISGNDNTRADVAALGLTTATGAVTGAALGAGVGAVVGVGVGAGVGTTWYFRHTTQETLREGTDIVFSLSRNMLLEPIAH